MDGLEEGRQLELGEHDSLVAAECAGQADDYEAVNVGEWEKAQGYILAWSSFRPLAGASELLVKGYLNDIRDAVPVGDHDSFLRLY